MHQERGSCEVQKNNNTKDTVPILYTEPSTSVLKCYSYLCIIIINQLKETNAKIHLL